MSELRNQIIRLAYKDAQNREKLLVAVLGGKQAYNLCREVPELCTGNLGLSRAKMPQVKDSFVSYLRQQGIRVKSKRVSSEKLRATQKEISADIIDRILADFRAGHFDPTQGLIVSRDGYVLNGHHRWAAVLLNNRRYGERIPLNVFEVDLPIRDLIDQARRFDGTEYRSVEETMQRMPRHAGVDQLEEVQVRLDASTITDIASLASAYGWRVIRKKLESKPKGPSTLTVSEWGDVRSLLFEMHTDAQRYERENPGSGGRESAQRYQESWRKIDRALSSA